MAEEITEHQKGLIAKEMFGENFHGEVPEEAAPDGEEETESEPQEVAEPETEEAEEAEAEEAEAESEAEPEEAVEEAEAAELSVSDIAQVLNVPEDSLDVDDDGHVVLVGKVNGEPVKKKATDLLASVQMGEAAEKRLEEAKAKSQKIIEEANQQREQLQEQFGIAARMIQNVEESIDQDSKQIDWKRLREDDPAEFAAKKQEFEERRKQVEQMKEDARQDYHKTIQQAEQQTEQQRQQHLQEQYNILLERVPEWKDQDRASKEKSELSTFLQNEGFSQEEINQAADARVIAIARKAMLYEKGQGSNDAKKKKIQKVPKVMKPGSSKPKEQVNKERLDKQKQKLQKTGSMNDALALLKARRGA